MRRGAAPKERERVTKRLIIAALALASATTLAGCASQPEWKRIFCTPAYAPHYVQHCVYERTR